MQSRHTILGDDVFSSYFKFTTTKTSYFYHLLYSAIHTTCVLFPDVFFIFELWYHMTTRDRQSIGHMFDVIDSKIGLYVFVFYTPRQK